MADDPADLKDKLFRARDQLINVLEWLADLKAEQQVLREHINAVLERTK